jgi:hypothetical protein
MKPKITLRKALNDSELLGSVLGGDWANWRALLLAANGEPLEPAELSAFREFTGRVEPPSTRIDELWCAIGRRGGKSRAMATLAAYYAGLCDYSDKLVRGEKGLLLLIAQDKRAAKISLDYIQGAFESTPLLNQLIKERQRDELRLTNGITVEVRAPSLRGVRGTTCIAIIADEIAFWRSDESVNPDQEILHALRPALLTTNGPLIAISSRMPVVVCFGRHTGVTTELMATQPFWWLRARVVISIQSCPRSSLIKHLNVTRKQTELSI